MRSQIGYWVAVYLPIIIGVVTALVLAFSSEAKREQKQSQGKRKS